MAKLACGGNTANANERAELVATFLVELLSSFGVRYSSREERGERGEGGARSEEGWRRGGEGMGGVGITTC